MYARVHGRELNPADRSPPGAPVWLSRWLWLELQAELMDAEPNQPSRAEQEASICGLRQPAVGPGNGVASIEVEGGKELPGSRHGPHQAWPGVVVVGVPRPGRGRSLEFNAPTCLIADTSYITVRVVFTCSLCSLSYEAPNCYGRNAELTFHPLSLSCRK